MESDQQVFCFLSPEIDALLADNDTSIVELLRHEGLNVSQVSAERWPPTTSLGYKEPVSLIIASAAVAVALTPILTRVIETLSRRPVIVEEQVLIPAEDSKGNVVHDELGKRIIHWVNRKKVLVSEDNHSKQDSSLVKIKGPIGLSITYKSNALHGGDK
jgi:hypothetical protein